MMRNRPKFMRPDAIRRYEKDVRIQLVYAPNVSTVVVLLVCSASVIRQMIRDAEFEIELSRPAVQVQLLAVIRQGFHVETVAG